MGGEQHSLRILLAAPRPTGLAAEVQAAILVDVPALQLPEEAPNSTEGLTHWSRPFRPSVPGGASWPA